MDIAKENIDKLIQFINLELKKTPKSSVNKICDKIGIKQSTFKTWAHKAEYKFDVNTRKYIKVIQKDNSPANVAEINIIQKHNKNIDMNKLLELTEMLEPLKEIIQEYNKSKNIVDVKPVELKVKNITEVKQKLFKIDVDVLKQWDKFVAEHKQFKVQNLISLALEEFMDKYK